MSRSSNTSYDLRSAGGARCPEGSASDSGFPPERADHLPALSVIIPVHNDAVNLEACLEALAASRYPAYEVIVIDDASADGSSEVATKFGARVFRQESRSGPAAARNRGAESARFPFLFFLDSDVAVAPDTLRQVGEQFLRAPDVAAFFGSYDAHPKATTVVSQYRNLLHHYMHQRGNEEAVSFWSGCGAIRKSVFIELGGFDAGYLNASIEDIELGGRLREAGHRIALVKSIQVKHLKKWTLGRMIRCDIRNRGIPWTLLVLRQGRIPNDLNLRYGQRLSALLATSAVLCVGAAAWDHDRAVGWALAAGTSLLALVLLNFGFYRLIARVRSPFFAVLVVPLHVLYYLCSGAAFAIGSLLHLSRRVRRSGAVPT